MKLKDLKKLPIRKWDEKTKYRSIAVIPSGEKHDSGWALMYIIGLDEKNKPIEIAAICDDICWKIPSSDIRTDMFFKSGAIHFWSNIYHFKVGHSFSSTDVELILNQ